jgi:hypothetical protein
MKVRNIKRPCVDRKIRPSLYEPGVIGEVEHRKRRLSRTNSHSHSFSESHSPSAHSLFSNGAASRTNFLDSGFQHSDQCIGNHEMRIILKPSMMSRTLMILWDRAYDQKI